MYMLIIYTHRCFLRPSAAWRTRRVAAALEERAKNDL